MQKEYTLSSTLIADGPVRALAYLPSGVLISGSENGAITCFPLLPSLDTSLPSNGDSTQHPHHITALICIPEQHPLSGGYVSGCKDNIIRVFNSSHEHVLSLSGHDKAVTSLSWLTVSSSSSPLKSDSNHDLDIQSVPPLLLSGSWDGTAKIWSLVLPEALDQGGIVTGTCLATLSGHENTVCVQGLSPPLTNTTDMNLGGSVGHLATTSAGVASGNSIRDHTVRFWEVTFKHLTPTGLHTTSCMVELKRKIANDHDGPIRGVALDEQSGRVFTCSNDGTVKARKGWNIGDSDMGTCLTTLSFTPQGNSPPMLLSVTCLEASSYSKDRGIVVSAEDGSVVVWNESTLEPQMILHPNCVWTVLPLPDGDFATACHDGLIRIFSRNPEKIATMEELAAFHEAVEEARAKKSGGGPSPEEIAKLPKWEINYSITGTKEGAVQVFNKGGRAIAGQWSQASRTWIEVGEVTGSNENAGTIHGKHYDHILPIEVDVPGGGLQQLQIGYNNGENPFVTAQNFIDEHMLDQYYLSQIADYIRSRVGHQAAATRTIGEEAMPIDLMSSTSNGMAKTVSTSLQHLPMKGFLCFDTGADKQTLEKVCGKIREFNNTLNNNLPPADVIDGLNNLCTTIAVTSRYHASSVTDYGLKIVHKMIQEWNLSHIFPALDLARLVVLHPDAARADRQGFWSALIDVTVDRCLELNDFMGEGSVSTAVPMLSFRLFANAFRGGMGSSNAVVSRITSILALTEAHVLSSNKNIRLAIATVLLNISSYQNASFGSSPVESGSVERVMLICKTIVESNSYESESIVRVLTALGTTILTNASYKVKAKALGVDAMLKIVRGGYSENVRDVCDEILLLLSE